MIADCTLKSTMQVEIRFAEAIINNVINRNTADEASAFATANSIRPMPHLISAVNATARMANAEAIPRKSGTRYMRNFAMLLSMTAMAIADTASFSENAPRAVSYTHLRAHETGRNLVCR